MKLNQKFGIICVSTDDKPHALIDSDVESLQCEIGKPFAVNPGNLWLRGSNAPIVSAVILDDCRVQQRMPQNREPGGRFERVVVQ